MIKQGEKEAEKGAIDRKFVVFVSVVAVTPTALSVVFLVWSCGRGWILTFSEQKQKPADSTSTIGKIVYVLVLGVTVLFCVFLIWSCHRGWICRLNGMSNQRMKLSPLRQNVSGEKRSNVYAVKFKSNRGKEDSYITDTDVALPNEDTGVTDVYTPFQVENFGVATGVTDVYTPFQVENFGVAKLHQMEVVGVHELYSTLKLEDVGARELYSTLKLEEVGVNELYNTLKLEEVGVNNPYSTFELEDV